MSLFNVDLNLLVALDALLQQRNVTRAAAQLNLSQSTVSGALGRLRRHFDDPLLRRVGSTYELTPLASRIRGRVRKVLVEAQLVFEPQSLFDSSTCQSDIRIILSDYAQVIIGPALSDLVAEEAPLARLRLGGITPRVVDDPRHALTTSDLLVLPHGLLAADLAQEHLYQDTWVCVVDEDNPDVGEEVTLQQLREVPWVLTQHSMSTPFAAAMHQRVLGFLPSVYTAVDNYLAIPALVAGSRRIGLVQDRLARRLAHLHGLRIVELPVPAGPLHVAMFWLPSMTADAEHTWLRSVLQRAVGSTSPGADDVGGLAD